VRQRSLVLCYHAVSDCWTDPLAVGATTLERQVRWLRRRGYRPVTAAEVLDNRRRTLHVTFDDAFRNIATALTALERLGTPVTVFACTRHAEGGLPLDVPELRQRAEQAPSELATMSWDALRELADRGVEIGSHTVSHPHLPRLSDTELRHELRRSKEQIEAQLGRRCRFLAYPYGEDDGRIHAAAQAAGYTAAFTLGTAGGGLERFALGRVDIYRGDGRLRFALKTSPLRRPAKALLSVARGR
jgi:peptidoglycan/xylan/chitin deacetylase (PgdA/CDA1 family)